MITKKKKKKKKKKRHGISEILVVFDIHKLHSVAVYI